MKTAVTATSSANARTSQKDRTRSGARSGFSLVELLFVVAIISMLAAVAIFTLSSAIGTSQLAKSRSNAQSICHLYQSARSVGARFQATTKEGILDELIAGKNGAGSFATSVFQLALEGEERNAALVFCQYDSQSAELFFRPSARDGS